MLIATMVISDSRFTKFFRMIKMIDSYKNCQQCKQFRSYFAKIQCYDIELYFNLCDIQDKTYKMRVIVNVLNFLSFNSTFI